MSSKDISFAPPRGMRDFYPEDMIERSFLFDTWKKSALRFGFQHYDACVVETMDLLRRKAGEEISDQIYTFKDKSDRDLALRPEMTPTLARMIAAKQGSLSFPIKWFSIPQCFRYERTTRGRKREHFQWNLDIVGDPSVYAEAEVIACAATSLASLGIQKDAYRVRFNNRRLLADLLSSYSIPEDQHPSVFLALDKKGKVPDEKIREILSENGIPETTVFKIDEMAACQSLDDVSSVVPTSPGLAETDRFLDAAAAFGIDDVLEFDLSVIRGLAYYTGIVFEAFDSARQLRAIFGGGRYDNLLSTIGGGDITAVGLGFGDVVVSELMRDLGIDSPPMTEDTILVGYMSDEQREVSTRIATALRRQGHNVCLASKAQKPKAFFKGAGGSNCAKAAFIGPDDVDSGQIKLKNLTTRDETVVAISEILKV